MMMMMMMMTWRSLILCAVCLLCTCVTTTANPSRRQLFDLYEDEDEYLDDSNSLGDDDDDYEGEYSSDVQWPAEEEETDCKSYNKQKANYLAYKFSPNLKQKPLTDVSVEVQWEVYTYAPWMTKKTGAIYAANTFGVPDGPGGYFGTILNGNKGGQFLFSLWDKRANKTVKAKLLTWPISMATCKRNCQDCGSERASGMSTGTQCKIKDPDMSVGDRYRLRLRQLTTTTTIDTKAYGGMPSGNINVKEYDGKLTGAVWRVTAVNTKTNKVFNVGDMLFEGDGVGVSRLGAFDEMVGCNKCNDVYHRDTRFGPYIDDGNGVIRKPLTMMAINRARSSTCQKFGIWGNEQAVSATFETGPGSTRMFSGREKYLWGGPN